MNKTKLLTNISALGACVMAISANAQVAPAAPPNPNASTPLEAFTKGKPIFELRARYETVDQARTKTLTNQADAYTLRTHIGFETATFHHVQVLVEGANVLSIGAGDFAVNVPGAAMPPLNGAGQAKYPLVNDPSNTRLNCAQITWIPIKAFSLTAGRQRLITDDQRFVGNVNWRQDEQTFDAVRADLQVGKFKLFGAYLNDINRVLGEDRNFDSTSTLLNRRYDVTKTLSVEAFAYLLDFSNSAINSSQTEGVRVYGKFDYKPLKLAYSATYARQSTYANAPTPFGLNFYSADVAATYRFATVKLNYEELDGNGVRGFTTPLATTHSFQGWSDAFVSPCGNKSFIDGIRDYNAALTIRPAIKPLTYFSKPEFIIWYHDFDDQLRGSNIGQELDISGSASVTKNIVLLVKYADFKRSFTTPVGAATPPASRNKFWVSLEFKL